MNKKYIVILSILSIIIASILIVLNINNKNNSNGFNRDVVSGTFEYEQSITNESIESTYYYSDTYFEDSSEKENAHLRTFAMSITLALNPTYRKDNVHYNIDKLLNELKFIDTEYYDMEEFGKDTIGTVISKKKLNEDYDLIVVVLRGAGYQKEWLSNFDLGTDGNAKGFEDASKIVLERLKKYINDNKINKYKLLVTGYSRSAAVAGLVGVNINNNLSDFNINKDDLYVYCYESPRYSNSDVKYNNIHNVINKNDIITYVYPESWGFYHSGVDEDITTNESNIEQKYLNIFASEKIITTGRIDKQTFIEKFISLLPGDRNKYLEISKSISNLYELFSNKNSNEKKIIIDFLMNSNIDFDLSSLITIYSLIDSNDKQDSKKYFDSLLSSYDSEYDQIKNVLNKQEYNQLKEDIFNMYFFLQPMIKQENNNDKKFINILTFALNANELFKEHYFSVNFEQVKKLDSYYK